MTFRPGLWSLDHGGYKTGTDRPKDKFSLIVDPEREKELGERQSLTVFLSQLRQLR